ncbi:MAG: HEPN domain-containing protein [Sulfolobaceae archaeon]
MTNAYVSCADLLLEQAKRDLEASRLLYDGKYMEQSLFYLQQATEKAHKTFRCVMQYLFQSVPEKIGECMESKLTESSPYYPLVYTVTYYIKQLKIDDIEKFLKEKYSHDTIRGFFEELEEVDKEFKFFKNILIYTLNTISQNLGTLIDDMVNIFIKNIIYVKMKELKNYLGQKHAEEEHIKRIIEYYNLKNPIGSIILSTYLYNSLKNTLQNSLNNIMTIFDEKTKEEYDKYLRSMVNSVSSAIISYEILVLLNLVLSNYAEASRYPDLKNFKPIKDRIPQYIFQNLEQLMNSAKLSLDFVEKLVVFIKNIDNNFSYICDKIEKNSIVEVINKIDKTLSIYGKDLSSMLKDINKLINEINNVKPLKLYSESANSNVLK